MSQDDQTISLSRTNAVAVASGDGAVTEAMMPGVTPGSSGPAHAADVINIPRRLGDVKLLHEIGRGGMGVVWLGHDAMLGRDVAVKFLIGAVPTADDPGFARFLEGARAAAAVQHPALTAIHQAGVVEQVPYIIMQYVKGPTLGQVLKQGGKLDREQALAAILDAAAALAELHDRNIVHRDIKPSNLLLDEEGHIFVTDFGLAHRRQASDAGSAKSWAGTPAYMAPEMFEAEVSARSDVYALGITAFELITGKPPFRGNVAEVREKHLREPLPAQALRDSGASEELIEILNRACHKDAMFRYRTARQMLRALETLGPDLKDAGRRCSLLARLIGRQQKTVSEAPGAPEPPSSTSLYDIVSTVAAKKRGSRLGTAAAASSNAPVEPTGPLCLWCGADRVGAAAEAPCPECGQPDDRAAQRDLCQSMIARPGRLIWRAVFFRPIPAGWWELLDVSSSSAWTRGRLWSALTVASLIAVFFRFLAASLAAGFSAGAAGGALRFAQVGPVAVESGLLLGWSLAGWVIFRRVWLSLILAWRDDLDAAGLSRIHRAADSVAAGHVAASAWQIAILCGGAGLAMALPWPKQVLTFFVAAWMPTAVVVWIVAWWRALAADRSLKVFPHRGTATLGLLVMGLMCGILHMLLTSVAGAIARNW